VDTTVWELLVGRDAERSVLRDVLGRLTAGAGGVVWLEG
jgi:hypothetical protein